MGSALVLACCVFLTGAAVPASTTGTIDLLDSYNLRIEGAAADDRAGALVAAAGDINEDGRGDVLIGAPGADANGRPDSGSVFVVFGAATPASLDLADLGTRGFRIDGAAAGDKLGIGAAGIGDANGDGRLDLAVVAPSADPSGRANAGKAYVVFGGQSADLDLAALGARGFEIWGEAPDGQLAVTAGLDGELAASRQAGDLNGDGRDDIVLGAPRMDPYTRTDAGSAYVVFGKGSTSVVDLAAWPFGGYRITGSTGERFGSALARLRDLNGDGRDELAVGAPDADNNARADSGSAFVIHGRSSTDAVEASPLIGGGYRIDGAAAGDRLGSALARAGRVSDDALDDLVLGARGAGGKGAAFVITGKADIAPVDLALGPTFSGYRIDGAAAGDQLGASAANVGDVNRDGLPDALVGAPDADPRPDGAVRPGAGRAFVVYGKRDGGAVATGALAGHGYALDGAATGDLLGAAFGVGEDGARVTSGVAGAGDLNGDAVPDLLAGAGTADTNGRSNSGSAYAIFAHTAPTNASPPVLTGSARSGNTLTASTGVWRGAPPPTFARRWQRCDAAGAGCAAIPGATAETYDLGPTDVGKRIRVEATATNAAGEGSAVSEASAVVVSATPETVLDAAPPDPSASASATFSFSSPTVGATFECDLDGAGWSACGSPKTYSALADGTHTFKVRALDPVVDPSPVVKEWKIDTSPPTVTLNPVPGGATNDPTPALKGTAGAADGSGTAAADQATVALAIYAGAQSAGDPVRSFSLARSGASWSLPDSAWDPAVPLRAPLGAGTYTADARQLDGAGNLGKSAERTFVIDLIPPATTVSSGPTGTITATTASFEFQSNEPGSSFECRLTGPPGSSWPWDACTSPVTYRELDNGSYTFEARARDPAGNLEAPGAARQFTVSGPTAEPSAPAPPSPSCEGSSAGNGAADEIVYASPEPYEHIWSVSPTTGATKLIKAGNVHRDLARSPRGQIAYSCATAGNWDIYIAEADGSRAVRLTSSPANETAPTFSPDGRKLAFIRDLPSVADDIFTMNLDGSAQTNISRTEGELEVQPSWGPTNRIAAHVQYTLDAWLVVRNPDGTGRVDLGKGESAQWAGDGSHLLYAREHLEQADWYSNDIEAKPSTLVNGSPGAATEVIRTRATRIEDNMSEGRTSYSPDGSQLLVSLWGGIYLAPSSPLPQTDPLTWTPLATTAGPGAWLPEPGAWENGPLGQTIGECDGGVHAARRTACDGEPVNTGTGAYVAQVTDLTAPAVGISFELRRSYASLDDREGALGRSWTHSYETALTVSPGRIATASSPAVAPGQSVLFRGEDGQRVLYLRQSDGSYVGPPGTQSRLIATASGYALTRRDQVRYSFDADGDLTAIEDRNGHGLAFTHGAGGLLATATDEAGRTFTFSYTAGRLTGVASSDGRAVAYGHSDGLLTSVTDVRGATTAYSYDLGRRLTKIVDQTQRTVIENVYGTDGRVDLQKDGKGKITDFAWDPVTETSTMTDARGKQWQDLYRGYTLIERRDPLGNSTKYEYDANLNVTKVIDARGNATTMAYDRRGNLIERTAPAPLSYRESFEWDAKNNPLEVIDRRRNATRMSYDAAGNLTSVTDPEGGVTTYERDPQTKLVTAVVDPRGKRTTIDAYDASGLPTKTTSPTGNVTRITYDPGGRIETLVDPRGHVTGANPADFTWSFTHNAANQPVTETDPLGHTTTRQYDLAGRRESVTDQNGHTTAYAYDASGRLKEVTAPDRTKTAYAYDDAGNLTERTDANLNKTKYEFDNAGRLTAVEDPLLRRFTYQLDQNGNVQTRTDAIGNSTPTAGDGVTTYIHDELDRLKSIVYANGDPSVAFGYDANDNLASITDSDGSETFAYDKADRLTGSTRGSDSFAYGYLADGSLDHRIYPGGTRTDYTYFDDGLLKDATVAAKTTSYEYDPLGQVKRVAYPNGYEELSAYDRAGRLERISHEKAGTLLARVDYTRDPVGNPLAALESGAGRSAHPGTVFEYDDHDRLTKACFANPVSGSQPACPVGADYVGYEYDPVGNRLEEHRVEDGSPVQTTVHDYDPADQLETSTLPGGQTKSYSHDANGNLTAAGPWNYAYDGDGRMKSAMNPASGTEAVYRYTGDGRRVEASIATGGGPADVTRYLWDTNHGLPQLALERNGSGGTLRRYSYGSERIGMAADGSDYYFHADGLGSVLNVTDGTGVAEWTYAYEPFGERRLESKDATGAPANPLGFTGEQLDSETGLYHLRARQYDPGIGRFTAVDPLARATSDPYVSAYLYADGAPTTHLDPSGLRPYSEPVGRPAPAGRPKPLGNNLECLGGMVRMTPPEAMIPPAWTPSPQRQYGAWRNGVLEACVGGAITGGGVTMLNPAGSVVGGAAVGCAVGGGAQVLENTGHEALATAIKVADTAKSGVQVVYHGGKRFIEGAPDFFGI